MLFCHLWHFSKPLYIEVISEFRYRNSSSNLGPCCVHTCVVPTLTDFEFSVLFVCGGTICLILRHFTRYMTFVIMCCVEVYCYMHQ